jgi:rubrerythrin
MEQQAAQSYTRAAGQAQDVGVRRLLGDLAEEEKGHESQAEKLTDEILTRPGTGRLCCSTSNPVSPA